MLNLLQQSRINPKISAYAQVHGEYDFNDTPVTPTGTHVFLHENQQFVEAGKFRGLMAGIWVTVFTTIYVLKFL